VTSPRPSPRLLAAALLLSTASFAATPAHWVGTWATAPVSTPNASAAFSTATTLRQIVHVSLGGSRLRVVFTNEFGTEPISLGGARVALGKDPATAGSVLSFGGQPTAIIPPGAVLLSDPVALDLKPLSDLTISLFLPGQALHSITRHSAAMTTNYEAPGDQLAETTLTDPHESTSWRFLKAVEVEAPAEASAVVAFGDSITDGAHSSLNANARWPDVLAQRLHAGSRTAQVAVLNEGIGGNRILQDGTGPNALARFDRDVLSQSGVRYVIVLEAINDIGHAATHRPFDLVTAQDLIAGLEQLILRAHAHGLLIFGATLTPYVGADYQSTAGEQMREAVNDFIRAPGHFDAVIDFDLASRDPAHPLTFLPAYDSGDHLHPRDAGYKAMGDSIDLKLFEK
jgi:lysophospholipase L1-like esterase